MIIPDKYTPLEKSLIFKIIQFHEKHPNVINSENIYYDSFIFKDIDEYIKAKTLIYILGIDTLEEAKEPIENDNPN